MKQYNISYEKNNVPQTILVEAVSAEVAECYFKHKKPDAKFYGIHEATADDMKPGKPVMLAKPFEVWKDCELGQTYREEAFFTKDEAYEWINKMERYYPGWHLRVVEVKEQEKEKISNEGLDTLIADATSRSEKTISPTDSKTDYVKE